MSIRYSVFSSFCEPPLAFVALLLQLIALCTSWWATFTARTELGKPEENGHYGLWTLCSTKGPHWVEDCDPLDTFFEVPPYSTVSAILGIFHILLVVSFIALGLLRILQVVKNRANLCIKSKTLRLVQVSIALCAIFLATLVAIFASIGENNKKEYLIIKGWSFWIQVFIIFLDVSVFSLCTAEFIKFMRQHWQQQVDPEGKRAETYGNPSFDADSPELSRSRNHNNGAISYTESSGNPYGLNPAADKNSKKTTSGKELRKNVEKDSSQTLTYENECYLESSPRARRRE